MNTLLPCSVADRCPASVPCLPEPAKKFAKNSSNETQADESLTFPEKAPGIEREPALEDDMFLVIALILLVAWIGGFVMFKSAGFLIHLLLIFAVISAIAHFLTGRNS